MNIPKNYKLLDYNKVFKRTFSEIINEKYYKYYQIMEC